MNDISIKAARGMFWSLAEHLGLQSTQLIVSIILARLLLPEEFGLIGLLTVFILLAQSLLDSGLGSALIRKKDASQIDACSIFYVNLVIGASLTLLLWLAAPFIATFYAQPLLKQLARFMSLIMISNSFRLVPYALLNKRLEFKTMFKISLASVAVSGGVGVSLAYRGFGVWSLAMQAVLESLMRVILVWAASRWRPSPIFSIKSLGPMFSFGSRLMISGLLDTFFNNIYQLFIGKAYSAADLGYYVRAQGMHAIAVQPASGALWQVIFPALVPIQDDRPRLKEAYRKIMRTAVFFHFPIMIGLIAIAEPLITLLLTDRWAASIRYFQLFCLVGLLWPLQNLNINILFVTGRSDLYLRLEVTKKILIVIALAMTFYLGIAAMLVGQIAISLVAYVLYSHFAGKLIDYSTAKQVHDIYPFLLMSVGMGISVHLLGTLFAEELARLLAQVGGGVMIYLALNFVLDRSVMSGAFSLLRNAIQVPKTI